MNIDEANKIARELWGPTGFAKRLTKTQKTVDPTERVLVGIKLSTPTGVEAFVEYARGKTWRQAIERAKKDRRSKGIIDGKNTLTHSKREDVQEPTDENAKIRRYMPFHYFEYLIQEEKLWFSRIDKMNDSHEGATSELNIFLRREQYQEQFAKIPEALGKDVSEENFLSAVSQERYNSRKSFFANCWQMDDYDDFSMWRSYIGEDKDGVAVESSFIDLKRSFTKAYETPIACGEVIYKNFDDNIVDDSSLYKLYLQKRMQFKSEKEIRALLWLPPYQNGKLNYEKFERVLGVEVPVNLKILIHRVIISPFVHETLFDRVQVLTRAKGLPDPIVSKLANPPIF